MHNNAVKSTWTCGWSAVRVSTSSYRGRAGEVGDKRQWCHAVGFGHPTRCVRSPGAARVRLKAAAGARPPGSKSSLPAGLLRLDGDWRRGPSAPTHWEVHTRHLETHGDPWDGSSTGSNREPNGHHHHDLHISVPDAADRRLGFSPQRGGRPWQWSLGGTERWSYLGVSRLTPGHLVSGAPAGPRLTPATSDAGSGTRLHVSAIMIPCLTDRTLRPRRAARSPWSADCRLNCREVHRPTEYLGRPVTADDSLDSLPVSRRASLS